MGFRAVALNPAWFRAAMHPILNYVEFRTNHEPYMVHGVVHGGMKNEKEFILGLLIIFPLDNPMPLRLPSVSE